MAEEDTDYNQYEAGLADFRAGMAQVREKVFSSLGNTDVLINKMEIKLGLMDVRLVQLEMRLWRWLLVAAVVGGLLGGLATVLPMLLP